MICDTKIVWQDIEVRTPRSWEMVRYGLHYERGVCTFSDEFHERFQLSWQRAIECPDFERLLSDLQSKEIAAHAGDADRYPAPEFASLAKIAGWNGLVMTQDGKTTTRAVRHFTEAGTLLEATIFRRHERDVNMERELLESIRLADSSDWRKWRAFGICAEVPTEMNLTSCRCLPGDTQWSFRGRKAFPSLTIHRMGFASVWLKESLRDWLQKKIPERSRVLQRMTRTARTGHPMELITTSRHRGRLGFLYGAKITRNDYACLCSQEQRVYHVTTETVSGDSDLVKLRCECGDLLPLSDRPCRQT